VHSKVTSASFRVKSMASEVKLLTKLADAALMKSPLVHATSPLSATGAASATTRHWRAFTSAIRVDNRFTSLKLKIRMSEQF
jgi:hypothetical protein